jgi:hypothetical protein
VLVHETTHGLLDALRPNFFVPSHPDVLGFHEGFADIIALLQHFSYPDVVENAIRESRGSLTQTDLLAHLAEEFGNALTTTEHPEPLRTAVDLVEFASFDSDRPIPPSKDRRGMLRYKDNMEEHDMGAVLLTAVFEAFVTIFRRKTERYYRIAGIVPDANGQASLSTDMIKLLAEEASSIAGRFLDICIRALDYCPPLDLELGEYLRVDHRRCGDGGERQMGLPRSSHAIIPPAADLSELRAVHVRGRNALERLQGSARAGARLQRFPLQR